MKLEHHVVSLERAKEIMKDEGLDDWKLSLRPVTDGICLRKNKLLLVGEKYNNGKWFVLFLRELAHALTPKSDNLTAHDATFADKLCGLVSKYMVPTDCEDTP